MQFQRTIGIDYSGAETAFDGIKGLRVFMTDITKPDEPAYEIPPTSGEEYWTRRELSKWLIKELAESIPTIAGIDHAFSFPDLYFEKYKKYFARDWGEFLKDFRKHWQTDRVNVNPTLLWRSHEEIPLARYEKTKQLRKTEEQCRNHRFSPSSVFLFSGSNQVGPSTHAGLPYLWKMRNCKALSNLHIWPFDGWEVQSGKSCLVEVYPSLYRNCYLQDPSYPKESDYPKEKNYPQQKKSFKDRQDAYAVASWLRDVDKKGWLKSLLEPKLLEEVSAYAKYEGWILGTPTTD